MQGLARPWGSLKFRQYLGFLAMLLLLLAALPWIYMQLNQDQVLYRQAEQALRSSQYQEAVRLYQSSRQEGMQPASVLQGLGEAYLALGEFNRAKQVFLELSLSRPQDQGPRLQLAQAMALSGEGTRALEIVEAILAHQPSWKTARIFQARILAWQGRFQEAIDIYYQILKEQG
ncbi:MAG: tetratricopeptide repeat protein [Desulfohalobiaceae bacterium]